MNLNSTQRRIFDDRYALRDSNGQQIETDPEQAFHRVANYIANNESEATEFYDLLNNWNFVPGGRIMAGAGAEKEKTFYNCYVIPVEAQREGVGNDSREAIFDTIRTMVDIMSRGGGVGINWSVLRPQGTYLTRVSGNASGPVGWMNVASTAVGEVEQGGSRRGAAMFMLDDWHPDVLRFINEKKQKDKIKNANVSVAISDEFMAAVERDDQWDLQFPDTTTPEYNDKWQGDLRQWKADGYPVRSYATHSAREIWRQITEAAHRSGEPGIVFLGRYNALSTAGEIEKIISVNPCGEQGLGAYSVCNLGSMNLKAYVDTFVTKGAAVGFSTSMMNNAHKAFNWERFEADVKTAIRFLDNVIDKTFYFLPQTERQQMKLRRIGLGVMGLADALILLKLRYGSTEAVEFTSRVFQMMKDAAIEQSNELAFEKGPALGWNPNMWDRPYLAGYAARVKYPEAGMRNLFLLTQAPTGTTAMWANVNSGIEPYFQFGYTRHDRTGQHYVSASIVEEAWPEGQDKPDYFVTSSDVTVEEHIAMQAAVQRSVDSSVSKTINAPNDQSEEDTAKAYALAWQMGLKGLAYYRDGSRSEQVLYKEDPNEVIARQAKEIEELKNKLAFRSITTGVPDKDYAVMGSASWFAETIPGAVTKTGNTLNFNFAPAFTGTAEQCPVCGNNVIYTDGCKQCVACEWSAC